MFWSELRDRLHNDYEVCISGINLYSSTKSIEIGCICLYCTDWVIESAAHSRQPNQTIRLYRVIKLFESYRGFLDVYRIMKTVAKQ